MKITDVECLVLLVPDYSSDACSSAQDNLVVRIHTDAGIVGIGETDTNPWAARAVIKAPGTHIMGLGLREMLLDADPLDVEGLWERMYEGSAMTGRRGLGICGIGALDMALWDIRGKASGEPVWKLLGGAVHQRLVPYASLLPGGTTINEYIDHLAERAVAAKELGFHAAKLEICVKGPYAHNNIQVRDDAEIARAVGVCREAVGPDMTLMVDVAYAWDDWKAALRVVSMLEPHDIYFLETPLRSDDLEGYAKLCAASPIRIAAGEWLNTRFECLDFMDRGGLDVIQPDVGRVGGLTEARRVALHARDRGCLVVPHCWKSGIGIAASMHLAAIAPTCSYIEYLPAALSDSALRRELTVADYEVVDGFLPLPDRPGLGVTLSEEACRRYRQD